MRRHPFICCIHKEKNWVLGWPLRRVPELFCRRFGAKVLVSFSPHRLPRYDLSVATLVADARLACRFSVRFGKSKGAAIARRSVVSGGVRNVSFFAEPGGCIPFFKRNSGPLEPG